MVEKIGGNINTIVAFGKKHNADVKPKKEKTDDEKTSRDTVSASPEAWQARAGIFKKAAKTLGGALYYAQTRVQNDNEDLNNEVLESLIPYGKDTMRCYKYYINEYHDYPEALALINRIASMDPKMLTKSPYISGFAELIKDTKGFYGNRFDLDANTLEVLRRIDTKDMATINGEAPGKWVGSKDGIAFAVFDTIVSDMDVSAEDKCEWLLDASEKLREQTHLDTSDFRKAAQEILQEYREFATGEQ